MARGGYRPNAGRPKSTGPKTPHVGKPKKAAVQATPLDIEAIIETGDQTPLEYMIKVMNDEAAEDGRRDRMAVAAAPYLHAKADVLADGKKAQRQANAEEAAAAGQYAVPGGPKLVVSNK